jgi:hypothetical protein
LWRGYKCRKNIRQAAIDKQAVLITDPQTQQNIEITKNVAIKLVEKCDQIQEVSRNVREEQTLGFKILHALNNWQKTYDFEIGTYTLFSKNLSLMKLSNIQLSMSLLDRCLEASLVMLVLPGVPMIVEGFTSNNRSIPAMNLAVQASEILLYVCKHPDAMPDLLKVFSYLEQYFFVDTTIYYVAD